VPFRASPLLMNPPDATESSPASAMLFSGRTWNIAARTAHIAAAGILLGGHAFDVSKERLLPALWAAVATGLVLAALEAGPSTVWFHQARGLMTLGKTGLLLAVPLVWDARLWILLVVVAIGSVGSHMPARMRYYSIVYKKVVPCHGGPGAARLENEQNG